MFYSSAKFVINNLINILIYIFIFQNELIKCYPCKNYNFIKNNNSFYILFYLKRNIQYNNIIIFTFLFQYNMYI